MQYQRVIKDGIELVDYFGRPTETLTNIASMVYPDTASTYFREKISPEMATRAYDKYRELYGDELPPTRPHIAPESYEQFDPTYEHLAEAIDRYGGIIIKGGLGKGDGWQPPMGINYEGVYGSEDMLLYKGVLPPSELRKYPLEKSPTFKGYESFPRITQLPTYEMTPAYAGGELKLKQGTRLPEENLYSKNLPGWKEYFDAVNYSIQHGGASKKGWLDKVFGGVGDVIQAVLNPTAIATAGIGAGLFTPTAGGVGVGAGPVAGTTGAGAGVGAMAGTGAGGAGGMAVLQGIPGMIGSLPTTTGMDIFGTGGSNVSGLGNLLSFLPGFGEGFGGDILGTGLSNFGSGVWDILGSVLGGGGQPQQGGGGILENDWLSNLLGLGGGIYAGHEQAKYLEDVQELQRDIANPQIEYMRRMLPLLTEQAETTLPLYTETTEAMAPLLQQRLGEGLDPVTARTIGQGFGRAGEELGQYYAGRGMLQSGPAATAYADLIAKKPELMASALQSQQAQAMLNALSFTGRAPTVGTPSIGIPPGLEEQDWASFGTNLADIFKRKSPTALTV